MAREVRITIDDDEVFERMKGRKRELDLSWEEVLHRGLRRETDSESGGGHAPEGGPQHPGSGSAAEAGHAGHGSGRGPGSRSVQGSGVEVHASGDSIGDVVDEFKDQIRGQVRDSLRASMASMEESGPGGLDREMSELEAAEDAVLRFEGVTGDERRYEIPLRVRLETSRDGLDVEVVTVREGKSVSGTNRFDRETRRAVNEHLARGGTGTLTFDGVEQYEVGPVLSWTRDDDGDPTVSDVDVEEVLFDE